MDSESMGKKELELIWRIKIQDLEKEKSELESNIQIPNIELAEIMEKSERLGIVIHLIEEKEMRWMELDEMQ